MLCETTVGTEKRRRLISVSLHAINYKHGAHGEITFFNRRDKRVNMLPLWLVDETESDVDGDGDISR